MASVAVAGIPGATPALDIAEIVATIHGIDEVADLPAPRLSYGVPSAVAANRW
jgi:hypothetical protein